jgi:hypothetical protein
MVDIVDHGGGAGGNCSELRCGVSCTEPLAWEVAIRQSFFAHSCGKVTDWCCTVLDLRVTVVLCNGGRGLVLTAALPRCG